MVGTNFYAFTTTGCQLQEFPDDYNLTSDTNGLSMRRNDKFLSVKDIC